MDDSALLFDHLGSSRRLGVELHRLTTDRVRDLRRVEDPEPNGLVGETNGRFACIDLPCPIDHPFAPGRAFLDFVLVLPLAFRSGDDSTTGIYVKVVARRNRLRHLLEFPPSEEEGRDAILAHERATLARWIETLFHNTRGVCEDFAPQARVGLLDRLGTSNEAIVERLIAFDRSGGSDDHAETRAVLVSLGFDVVPKRS